jgi:hypothetical protein
MAIMTLYILAPSKKGIHMTSEDPLEDVWSLLGLYGSEEFLRENVTEVKDIEALADYVAVRIRQANELREASRETTLLTAPLSLYLLEPW